ncbi:putative damage-inducible protein DinB [Nocardiopsis mwathae]|uniref:Putative damage-inducible protein DinB n=1 Tax=Nocardiopsis mwathae TaxID=1472723 RepID=A0A7W9YDU5_9ACTN|nr:DinB family protein [Nocardiopsis mwathae]MBB6170335.1 putative damage-inducible protein DinB [Nocardiopsis mwathae]
MSDTERPESPFPRPLTGTEKRVLAAAAAGERETLEAFLDDQRAAVVRRASGLSEDDARRRLVPSKTTLAGMLRHLAIVERNWFQHRLLGRDRAELGLPADDLADDPTWDLADGDTLPELIADYERACAESRAAAAGLPLERTFVHPQVGELSLRWLLVHMVEETARHAGHADILREQTDGTAGF